MHDEQHEAAVAAILSPAGFAPHPFWGTYTRDTFVVGVTPDGLTLHVKDWAAVPVGHPLYGPDTPDTPEEAAAWLVSLWLTQQAGLVQTRPTDAIQDRPKEYPQGQDHGPAAEAPSHPVDSGSVSDSSGDNGGAEAGPNGGGLALYNVDGQAWPDSGDGDSVYDADFDEVGSELGELGDADDLGLLAPPEPEDFDPEPIKSTSPSDAVAIFGDDLHRLRLFRQGELSDHAYLLIERVRAAGRWSDEEFVTLQGHVVSHLDKHTGLYSGGDERQYERFLELSDVQSAVRRIEMYRDQQAEFIRGAPREVVESYDSEAGWP